MKNFKVFINPFLHPSIARNKTSKYQVGGTIGETPQMTTKPLNRRQMKKLSNNWENGSQSYYHNGNYYDEIGQPMTQAEHAYFYNKDLSPRVADKSTIQGLNTAYISNQNGQSSENFNSRFETVNHFPDGTTQTLRTHMYNGPDKSYEITYDPNHMDIMFNVNGISKEEALKLINK